MRQGQRRILLHGWRFDIFMHEKRGLQVATGAYLNTRKERTRTRGYVVWESPVAVKQGVGDTVRPEVRAATLTREYALKENTLAVRSELHGKVGDSEVKMHKLGSLNANFVFIGPLERYAGGPRHIYSYLPSLSPTP